MYNKKDVLKKWVETKKHERGAVEPMKYVQHGIHLYMVMMIERKTSNNSIHKVVNLS
jgi:hypothetical protein